MALGFQFSKEKLPLLPNSAKATAERDFRQLSGQMSSGSVKDSNQMGPLENDEKRWFGIGQGNLRVTPLQVANAMAAIARGGIYKSCRLFEDNSAPEQKPLGVSQQRLNVILDGMHAVINENGGTAHNEFAGENFASQGIKVYGKTGTTEAPEHAWFAGFAKDGNGGINCYFCSCGRG